MKSVLQFPGLDGNVASELDIDLPDTSHDPILSFILDARERVAIRFECRRCGRESEIEVVNDDIDFVELMSIGWVHLNSETCPVNAAQN